MRKLTVVAVLLSLLLGVANCVAFAAPKPVEITFWYMGWGVNYESVIKDIISDFEAEYPNIKVRAEVVPWQAGWYEKFLTAVTGRVAPDISEGASYQPILFAAMNEILPVDDIIAELERDGRVADLASQNHKNYYMDGHYWAVPIQTDPRLMAYRKDFIDEAGMGVPSTWDEFLAVAKKLTTDFDGDGRVDRYGFAYPAGRGHQPMQTLLTFMLQNGAYTLDENGTLAFGSEKTVEALRFLTDLTLKHKVTPPGILDYAEYADVDQLVYDGKAAMVYTTDNFFFNAMNDDLPVLDQLAVLPPLKGPEGHTGLAGFTNPIMIYKQTKHPEEAKTFLRFYLRPENLSRLYACGDFHWPAEKQFFALERYQQSEPIRDIANKVLPVTHDYTYPSDATPIIPVIEGELMWADAVQLVLAGRMSVEEAVSFITAKMGEAVELNQ